MIQRFGTIVLLGATLALFGACGPADTGTDDPEASSMDTPTEAPAETAPEAPATEAEASPSTDPQAPPTADELTLAEVLPLSCLQVWETYRNGEGLVVEIVKAMAGTSVETRGLEFPQTTEAGAALGAKILEGCAADRDQLLYAIVDRGVREVVAEAGGA